MKYSESFWQVNGINTRNYRTLENNIKTEVCIIGGGITGISTAYYLQKAGKDVVVLEKDKIVSKTSGKTTGKITSQHHLFYHYLIESFGKDFAKKYWKAGEEAISEIEKIIKEEQIDCDFERKSAFVFTRKFGNLKKINDEIEAAKSLEIPAKFTNEIEVLEKIEGAIEFPNQAQFHPVKYVNALAHCVLQKGGEIFENARVVDYSKNDEGFVVKVDNAGEKRNVFAKYLVVATRYPIFNVPGFHFIKMYQEMEYAMAIKTSQKVNVMYVSSELPNISFRGYEKDGENYVILVGNGHKTGENDGNDGFITLEKFVKENFKDGEIISHWHAEDAIGLDKIPYIGDYSEVRQNMFVATGFKKWGMTSSNISARMITDQICQGKSKYDDIFQSTRLQPIKNHEEMKNMLKEVGENLIAPHLKPQKGQKYCAHLGCQLSWNQTTQTWDCPCHGSRYEQNGQLIEGPSVQNIE